MLRSRFFFTAAGVDFFNLDFYFTVQAFKANAEPKGFQKGQGREPTEKKPASQHWMEHDVTREHV